MVKLFKPESLFSSCNSECQFTTIRFSRPKLAGMSSEFVDVQFFYNYLDPAERLLAVIQCDIQAIKAVLGL